MGGREEHTLRFLFTIYENQRWWMGLDWTAALLPAERPSWSVDPHTPVSPPHAFGLPETTVSYLPAAKGAGTGGVKRVKRTARWSWGEGEWRVVVRREKEGGVRREKRVEEGAPDLSTSATTHATPHEGGEERPEQEAAEREEEEEDALGADVVTDADGWVYGDNKWEGGSAKGGLGKVRIFPSLLSFFPPPPAKNHTNIRSPHFRSTRATGAGRA